MYKIILPLFIVCLLFADRRIPAEWETQDAIWLQWPLQFEHWMRSEMAETISTIQEYESVHLIVQNQNHLTQAQNQIQNQGGDPDDVTYHIQIHNNAWLRDNGPVYAESDDQLIIQNMEFDGWGGLVNDFEEDNGIPCQMAEWLNMECENLDFIMERGNLEFNGAGTLISNWDCWIDRNPSLNQTELEVILMDIWGLNQIVWTYGHSQYDVTTGHIDGVARFINDSTVVVSQYSDSNDEDAWISEAAAVSIANAGFNVIRIDMPGYINYYGYIVPAIYVNWLQINGAIIGNAYNVSEWDTEAQETLESFFPGYDVILLFTPEVNLSGGGTHCITNDQPSFTPISSLELDHSAGWNMIGLPLEVEDASYTILFPESIEGTLYSFNDGYNLETSLIQGEGYWLSFNEAGSNTITGNPINELTIGLNEGWNLISGITNSLHFLHIHDPDGLIIPGTIYGFTPEGYSEAEILHPGKGYWIRANNSGYVSLISNPELLPAECYIVPEVGPCDGICPTYYYNQDSDECEEFITGCCGVEAFDTMEECISTCE